MKKLYRFTVIYSMNPSRLVRFLVKGVAGTALLALISEHFYFSLVLL